MYKRIDFVFKPIDNLLFFSNYVSPLKGKEYDLNPFLIYVGLLTILEMKS